MKTTFRQAAASFRRNWKSLFVTDVVYKTLAFALLTPLVSGLFRSTIALSGNAVLSDVDIVKFFLGPAGWVSLIVAGALTLAIVALEHASLMGILYAHAAQKHLGTVGALRFAATKAWPVICVTARALAWVLVASAPFLAVAGIVYFALLGRYDINYYLSERPPVFRVAVGVGVVLFAGLAALLLRLVTSWFFALPLVLFEDIHARDALRISASRTCGRRWTIVWWVVGWLAATALLSTIATGMIGVVGSLLLPDSTNSLQLLAVSVGLILLFWMAGNAGVNLLSTTSFATVLLHLYLELGKGSVEESLRADFAAETARGPAIRITRGRLWIGSVIGLIVAVVVGTAALETVQLDDRVAVMAHRGSSMGAPENTLAAIRKAIDDGADWVEIDVQETADGEVVVFHDSDFMKLAGVDLKIWDATMEDLKDLDVGSWFAPEFKDERVPTLAQVLDLCKGKIGVNIELKYYGHDEQLERRVAEIVEAHDMAAETLIMSLKMDAVRKMKSIRPKWKVGLLMSVVAGDVSRIEADFLAVNARFADSRLIQTARDDGKEIYVWTVNDAPTMSTMISRGVDGLLTDKPALARSVLRQRAEMNVAERLLLELAALLGTVPDIAEQ